MRSVETPALRRRVAAFGATAALALGGCTVDVDFGGEDDVGVTAGQYTAETPPGWEEASEDERAEIGGQAVEGVGEDVEVGVTSLWAVDLDDQSRPSIIVFREPVPEGVSRTKFIDISLENAKRAFGGAILRPFKRTAPAGVDGERAESYDYRILGVEAPLRKRALFIFHGDDLYALTLTAPPAEFTEAEKALDDVLDSWRWTG